MDSIIIYFLPTIIALGAVTSYEDIKTGKIRNLWLVLAAALGLATYAILILLGKAMPQQILVSAVYGSFALIIGFVLWYFKWWYAGDAKLLAAFAFIIPPQAYVLASTRVHFLDILLNGLLPLFIYLIVILFLQTTKKAKIESIKETLAPKKLFTAIVAIFSISWLNIYIFTLTGVRPEPIMSLLIIFVVLKLLQKTLKEMAVPFLVLVAIIRIFLNTHYYMTKSFLVSFLVMMLLYLVVIGFVRNLSSRWHRTVGIYGLMPGMVLEEGILRTGTKAEINARDSKEYIVRKTKPLTERDIQKIKTLHATGQLHFNHIRTQQTIAFAPHIFAGALITLACGGNLILFLRYILTG